LELPIDHFRLLGVGPTTDGQTVLRTLQQRLDRAPEQGFTQDTLQARADLLRASAELLSDEERRQAYERELTAISSGAGVTIAALEIPPSKEVAGLLLLMEAGQALEAFEQARKGLQPPQAPALGSSREADLTLLAGLACEAAAEDYRQQRHFEAAAITLQLGMQLLQRMGQLPERRRALEMALDALLPYRVLDLLSRELSASDQRREGIQLLEQLVQRRGGLEGDGDAHFPQADFQPFFKQIRQFLTVQEQIDLFSRWAELGSATADFLASFALTAAGFVQRKPERIQAAYNRLQASEQPGVEPFLACQQVLLGQIDRAQELFEQGADSELRQWAREQGEDSLAGLCAYCRDWLSRDVLPGFRDIDADAADLEAWFADRDVQAYVEQQDRIRARAQGLAEPVAPAAEPLPLTLDWGGLASAETPASPAAEEDSELSDDEALWDGPFWAGWSLPRLPALPQLPSLQWPALPSVPALSRPVQVGIAVVAVGAAVIGWLGLRPRPPVTPTPIAVQPLPPAAPTTKPAPAPVESAIPLSAASPSDAQIKALLEAWLEAKAALLAGRSPAQAPSELARPNLVAQVEQQVAREASAGRTSLVEAQITSLEIVEASPRRIEANVSLSYSEQQRGADGQILSRSPSSELRNTYVFARDGDRWLLAAYRPSP